MKNFRMLKYKNYFLFIFAFIFGCTFTLFFTNIEKHGENHHITKYNRLKRNDDPDTNFLLVVILSAPKNHDLRDAVRETWLTLKPKYASSGGHLINRFEFDENGFYIQDTVNQQKVAIEQFKKKLLTHTNDRRENSNIKIVHRFVVGTVGLSSADLGEIMAENKQNDDLLILNDFHDSYMNLTKKLLKSFAIIQQQIKFKYLLKTDDDSYVKLDQLANELYEYDVKLVNKPFAANTPIPDLYWGYFNGRANIKRYGKWKESNYNLCGNYLPYALGGGYVLSNNLVDYIAKQGEKLMPFVSEDTSVGTWLSTFRNIYRKHDIRFDTGYLPRKCRDYHLILHKRSIADMYDLFHGNLCNPKYANIANRPNEYFYDWNEIPLRCCNNLVE